MAQLHKIIHFQQSSTVVNTVTAEGIYSVCLFFCLVAIFPPGLFFVDPLFSNISFFLQLTSFSKHGF